jgi:hypothetical protein
VKDITRAGELKEERIDKLWDLINKANKAGWVTTFSSPPIPQHVSKGLT